MVIQKPQYLATVKARFDLHLFSHIHALSHWA